MEKALYCVAFFLAITDSISVPDNLVQITNHLKISSAIVLDNYGLSINEYKRLLKQFNAHLKTVSFKTSTTTHESQNFILFSLVQDFNITTIPYTIQASIVITEIKGEEDLSNMNLDIGKEVYFLDWKSLALFECYNINSIKIINHLGNFFNTTRGMIFQGSDDYRKFVICTRGTINFWTLISAGTI